MAAQVEISGNDFQVGDIKGLFRSAKKGIAAWRYDVSPDGQRFLVRGALPEHGASHMTIVTNSTKLLAR